MMTFFDVRNRLTAYNINATDDFLMTILAAMNSPVIFDKKPYSGWQNDYCVGDTVILLSNRLGTPELAVGNITAIEYGFDTTTGRPKEDYELNPFYVDGFVLEVCFDLTPLQIPHADVFKRFVRDHYGKELPEYQGKWTTWVNPNQVMKVV